jgi:hypothetical protein
MDLLKAQGHSSPTIAGMLIVVLLLGWLPMLTGVMIVPGSKPAFTVDICHPAGAVAGNLNAAEAPLIPAQFVRQKLAELGTADQSVPTLRSRLREAPIPPPPKPLFKAASKII